MNLNYISRDVKQGKRVQVGLRIGEVYFLTSDYHFFSRYVVNLSALNIKSLR